MLATLASSRLLSMSATQLGYTLSALSSRVFTPPILTCSRKHNVHSNIRTYAAASSSDSASELVDLPTVLSKVRQAIRGSNPLEHAKSRNVSHTTALGWQRHAAESLEQAEGVHSKPSAYRSRFCNFVGQGHGLAVPATRPVEKNLAQFDQLQAMSNIFNLPYFWFAGHGFWHGQTHGL